MIKLKKLDKKYREDLNQYLEFEKRHKKISELLVNLPRPKLKIYVQVCFECRWESKQEVEYCEKCGKEMWMME